MFLQWRLCRRASGANHNINRAICTHIPLTGPCTFDWTKLVQCFITPRAVANQCSIRINIVFFQVHQQHELAGDHRSQTVGHRLAMLRRAQVNKAQETFVRRSQPLVSPTLLPLLLLCENIHHLCVDYYGHQSRLSQKPLRPSLTFSPSETVTSGTSFCLQWFLL